MRPALARIILYMAVILAPFLVVSAFHLKTQDVFAYNLGRSFAQLAFAIFTLQVILASRLRWVERPFGLNVTFPFHRRMGTCAAVLLLLHPPLIAMGGGGLDLLISLRADWWILVGKSAWVLFMTNIALSLWRTRWGIKFERWRLVHDLIGPTVGILAFVHSWYGGEDLKMRPMQVLWVTFLCLAVVLFVYHRLLRPALLREHLYRVLEVKPEADRVWTVRFAPPPGERRFEFLPGQFQFVTLLRGSGFPEEEHHFTISSSPSEVGYHASTIKESGDFTATIGQTRAGDAALIQAPFGRFSYLLHPEVRDMVYLAGGVGITPLMSNLRHMRDTRADRRVLLLYANRAEADIVFRQELAEMEEGDQPELKVVHILSRPSMGWTGETGHVDRDKLRQLCVDRLADSTFFLCCPPGLVRGLVRDLRALGVPYSRISYEYFTL